MKDLSADTWVVKETKDRITGKTGLSASIWSMSKVELKSPYEGSQQLLLNIGRNPSGATYAFVAIVKGQFFCSNCSIRVKFDEGGVEQWRAAVVPQQTNVIHFRATDEFIFKARNSKKVLVEVPFFDYGDFLAEFKLDGTSEIR